MTDNTTTNTTSRLTVVDALRGWALMAIVILHCLEHYNLFYLPEGLPTWLTEIDRYVFDGAFLILGGNAYATFSLLFGFSFYIQMRNARKRGCDFRARFAWRMLLLACFALLHSLFYNGDILLLYAACGLLLIPACSVCDRKLVAISVFLICQPVAWCKVIHAAIDPSYIDTDSLFMPYAIAADNVGRNGDIAATIISNIRDGILYSNFWQIESGRISLTPALFIIGMLLGRNSMFENSDKSRAFWRKALIAGIAASIPLYILKTYIPGYIENPTMLNYYNVALSRMLNAATTTVLVSVFVCCWFSRGNGFRLQRILVPYGRMSLTNYIGQSIIGVSIFYNCGLGFYDKTGATACVAIGLIVVASQLAFSRHWLSKHNQGPLEYIWKRLTWWSPSTLTTSA